MSDKKTVYIHAVADSTKPSGYRFWMVYKNQVVTQLDFNKNIDKMKKSQYYTITFALDPNENAGLRFSHDESKVFWAKEIPNTSAPCVSSECYLAGIFVDPATPIQDREIKVINIDSKMQLFAFAFNFLRPGESDPPATSYALYDPIGNNQNGGNPFTSEELLVGFGAAVAGALLGTYVIAPALS